MTELDPPVTTATPGAASAFSRREGAFLPALRRGLWQLSDGHVDALLGALQKTVWWRRTLWNAAVVALGATGGLLAWDFAGLLGAALAGAATAAGLMSGGAAVPERALFRRLERTGRALELVRPARDVLYRLFASCRSVDVTRWLDDFGQRLRAVAAAPSAEAEAEVLAPWLDPASDDGPARPAVTLPPDTDDRAREAFVEWAAQWEAKVNRREGVRKFFSALLTGGTVTAYTVLFFGFVPPKLYVMFFHGLIPVGVLVLFLRSLLEALVTRVEHLPEDLAQVEDLLQLDDEQARALLHDIEDQAKNRRVPLDEAAASAVYTA